MISDIFIAYSNKDRDTVQNLVHGLATKGWIVFWDQDIPVGKNWGEVIENELEVTRCVLVVWSSRSKYSGYVLDEAQAGMDRKVLFPVKIEDVKPPLGFGRLQTADLSGWDGTVETRTFNDLVRAIAKMLGPPRVLEDEEKKPKARTKRKAQEMARASVEVRNKDE